MSRQSASTFSFPCTGIAVENNAVLLAIDDMSLPFKRDVCYYISRPRLRQEPVVKPSDDPKAPDNLAACFYGTVLQEGGKFRMWYYGAQG